MPHPVLAFDVFGTLADPGSYADGLRTVAAEPDNLAAAWRGHQLEISWLVSLADHYRDWPTVTADALDMTLSQAGIAVTDDQRQAALRRAGSPALFDDVAECLSGLRAAGFPLVVFSNGNRAGLEHIVGEHGIADMFSAVVSCEEVGAYKPDPATYRHVAHRVDRPIGQVWLISGNPFDCAGAALAGMHVVKVDRAPTTSYPFAPPPDLVIENLAQLPRAMAVPE